MSGIMKTLQTVQTLLIKEFGLAPEQVHADAKLEALGIDSLATIEFMFLLEETFKLRMSEAPAAVRTVGDIALEIDALSVQASVPALQS
jgi:acyl carrier protein